MMRIERFFWGHMLAAVAALSIGYAFTGFRLCSLGLVLLGLVWFSGQQRKARGIEGPMLLFFVLAGGVGYFLGAPGWLMLLGLVAALGAWDLNHFLGRLGLSERVEFGSGLGSEHLRRLALVEMTGMLGGLAAISLHVQITFWWEVLLTLLVVVGISRLIVRIRKETGDR